MSGLSTHILNTTTGLPAANIKVTHSFNGQDIVEALSNPDGRVLDLLNGSTLEKGQHKLVFEVGPYFESLGVNYFFPLVTIHFLVEDESRHHHVPLLLSPFGFTTYRGS